MQTRSLLLDTDTWDITLDDSGNLAVTDNPYAVAQDVACACSAFQGECWYDTSLGIPYYSRVLGHWPGTQLINVRMQQEAMKLSYVASAVCTAVSDRQRGITGVMMITDTNNVNSAVGL